MHYLYRMLSIGVVCLAGPALALAADVDSRIDSVTIYPGHTAEIKRIARVSVQAGQDELVFSNLPSSTVNGSVRVAVIKGDMTLGGVETARVPVGESPRERERQLRHEIETLTQEREDALDRVAAAKNEVTFIEGLAELPKGKNAAEALMGEDAEQRWQSLWERIGTGSLQARQRVREGEREAHELQKEIDTLKQKLDQLGRSRQQAVNITIPYRSSQPGNAELELTYRVRGPSWIAQYEARLDTASGKIRLNRTARVSQATGEDWTDIKLALSTSQPVYGERPELSPWWIDFAPEPKPMAKAESRMLMQESMVADEVAGAAAPAPSTTVNAEFAATYEITGRVTIPAGNEPRELSIASHELDAAIGAETMPQIDPRAWLIADTKWEGEGPLPPGLVSRFRDGAYIGEGQLESWAPGEERTLAFGIDPQVEVAFKPTKDEAGKSGWVTTKSTLVRNYTLEIINHHSRSLPITALIRMPVSKNEDIEVETSYSVEPSEKDVDGDKGVNVWALTLDANDSRSMGLGYKVNYPEGKNLMGL